MASSFRLGLMIVALLAGSLALACGGGDGTSDDDGDGAGDQPEASDGDDADTGGDGDGDDLPDELRKLAEEFGVREVKIEYSFSSAGDGSPDDEGTITLYWKPPDAWRVDISSSAGDLILINSAGTSYLCTSDGGTGQCLESPIADVVPIPFLSVFTDPDALSELIDVALAGVDVDRSDRTIAGQDATCFSISATIEGETGATEYCFREDGILLLFKAEGSEGSGEFALEATKVEESVSDSDLEPPYDVTEIPGLP